MNSLIMTIPYCYLCESHPDDKQKYGDSGFADGDYCPICYRPFCRHHSGVVRWRWKETREVASARICIECKRAYLHRGWDVVHREWIS